MQHVRSLECFVAVAQNKSIRAAADAVHLSASALNRQVLELEQELGAPLFERHARGVRLSAAGEAYLRYARQAIRDAELVQSHIDALRSLRKGQIKVAAVAAMADERLIALVADFQRTYPQVGFTLNAVGSSDVIDAVLNLDVDLGLVFNLSAQRDFHELASRTYSLHAMVPVDHALAQRDSVSIAALRDFPMALGDHSWGGRRLLDEYLHKNGLQLHPQLVSNSIEVLTKFVKATGGVYFQIRAGSQAQAIDGGLVAIPVKELKKYERHMVLGCLHGRPLPSAAALFAEMLKRELFLS